MMPNPSNLEIALMVITLLLPTIILLLPAILLVTPCRKWLIKHLTTFQNWLLARFNLPLLKPINFQGHKSALVLTSLVVYLTAMNAMGLLPFIYTPAMRLSLNIWLAFPLWTVTIYIGARAPRTLAFGFKKPRTKLNPLTPLYILMKVMSCILRPLTLAIQIAANLTVAHLLIHYIAEGGAALITLLPNVVAFSATILLLVMILEAVIALIQAYVFVLLISSHLQENT